MTLIARPATPGLWLDMSARPTPEQARAIVSALDPVGIIRTLPLPRNSDGSDLDAAELSMWCTMGIEVMAYQHVRSGPWDPRNHSGAEDGTHAVQHWLACEGAELATIWVDWEDLVSGLPIMAGKKYLEEWAACVFAANVRAGEYCGFDDPMSPYDRYYLHGVTSYWSDVGHRAVAIRGTSIVQGREATVAGLRVDFDHLAFDRLGDVPFSCSSDEVSDGVTRVQ